MPTQGTHFVSDWQNGRSRPAVAADTVPLMWRGLPILVLIACGTPAQEPEVRDMVDAGAHTDIALPEDAAQEHPSAAQAVRPSPRSARPAHCPEGSVLAQGHCVVVDPCEDLCDVHADCTIEDGATQCRCRTGYQGDGERCEPILEEMLLELVGVGPSQTSDVCARARAAGVSDAVVTGLCARSSPRSMTELLDRVGLGFRGPHVGTEADANGRHGNPSFALTGHSAAVARRQVSPLNPRAVIFTPNTGFLTPTPGFVAAAYTRGEPIVEFVAHDAQRDALAFYLLQFGRACEAEDCAPEEYTEQRAEHDWTQVTLYDEHDLAGTILDCAPCHEGGWREYETPYRSPLMFEAYRPWVHWFRDSPDAPEANADTGMIATFLRARGEEERYAGIPISLIPASSPESVEFLLVANGYGNGFSKEFVYNGRPFPMFGGVYRTWELQEVAETGQIIQPPHPAFDPSSPEKIQAATTALDRFRSGDGPYPSMRDMFREGEAVAFGVAVRDDASAPEILAHACTQCHHDGLRQDLPRARFSMDRLDSLPAKVLREAIWRLGLPPENLRAMPPRRFRDLDPRQRARVVEYLRELELEAP